jgi:predicted O-methyltransferase YrrM
MYKPPLVLKASLLAQSYHFDQSCLDEIGQLLSILGSHVKTGAILEIGTGYGVNRLDSQCNNCGRLYGGS